MYYYPKISDRTEKVLLFYNRIEQLCKDVSLLVVYSFFLSVFRWRPLWKCMYITWRCIYLDYMRKWFCPVYLYDFMRCFVSLYFIVINIPCISCCLRLQFISSRKTSTCFVVYNFISLVFCFSPSLCFAHLLSLLLCFHISIN